MSRTPPPRAVALRNQLLAILRDAEQPLTTQQVAGRVTGIAAQKRLSQHLSEADTRCAYWHYLDADADHALNALLDAVQDA